MCKTTIYKKAITAGLLISLAQLFSISMNNPILSPLCFSFGLISVFLTDSYLYTGKISYSKDIKFLFTILFFNFMGCFIGGVITPSNVETASFMVRAYSPLYVSFFRAFVCGMFIYLSTLFKDNHLYTIFCVVGFIICGGEHCIADFAYIVICRIPITLQLVKFLVIIILGNSYGSLFLRELLKQKDE